MAIFKASRLVELLLVLNLVANLAVVVSILFMILLMGWFNDANSSYVLGCVLGCLIVAVQLIIATKQSEVTNDGKRIALLAIGIGPAVLFTLATFAWA